jgi:transient receptor potential cation channel subfamily M protein 2
MFKKIAMYFAIFWNKLDTIAIILFFIACILRFLPINRCFCGARVILAVDLFIWYIRTLDIFSAVKRLGPKLVMIGEMVNSLTLFLSIFLSF